MRQTYWAAAAMVLAAAGSAQAGYTPILASNDSPGGATTSLFNIFVANYGTAGGTQANFQTGEASSTFGLYTFTRVHDFSPPSATPTDLHAAYTGTTLDTRFQDGSTQVSFTTKYAGYNNRIGFSNDGTGGPNPTITTYTDIIGSSGPSVVTNLSSNFQLVLNVNAGLSTSLQSTFYGSETNTGGEDHFVTWYVTDGARNFWVIAAEDLVSGNGSDHDYNDWVGELQVVPLPPAAWAGLGSLACVAGFGVIRRRRMMMA